MSAKTAIKKYCRWCCMESYSEVDKCETQDCFIWKFRTGDTIKGESKQKAIQSKCKDCIQIFKTAMCKESSCPLFPYKNGHRPKTDDHVKRVLSSEHIKKMQENRPKKSKPATQIIHSDANLQTKSKRRLITRIKPEAK